MSMHDADDLPQGGKLFHFSNHPALKIAIPLVIIAIALFVLHKLSSELTWRDIQTDVAEASGGALLKAVTWVIVSYIGIALYDTLAARAVAPKQIPARIAALTGAAGYAISGFLGMSYFTGTAVRYRVYAGYGLDLVKIAGLIFISWSGFLTGAAVLFGGFLVFHPQGLSAVLPISPLLESALGAALLAAVLGYYFYLGAGRRSFELKSFSLTLPPLRIALGLTGAGLLDLAAASMTLYVLLPADLVQNLPFFLALYASALCLGILSHAPGGLGVFEATIIAGLGAAGRSDVIAALLLYRLAYTLLPFMIAALGLGVSIGWIRGHRIKGGAAAALRHLTPLVPPLAAGIALLAGGILLLAGTLPTDETNLRLLRQVLPLLFIEASHLAGSLAGLLLIVVAHGLYRKLHRAWLISMILMAIGLVAALVKGLAWQESLSMLATMALLGLFKPAFYRADGGSLFRLDFAWTISLIVMLAAAFWIGLFAYSNVPYRNTLWWDFKWDGDASRFLRASLIGAAVIGVIALNTLINGRAAPRRPAPIPGIVHKLLAQSKDADANLSLTGDKSFLIAEDETAFIAYAETRHSLIARGDPVGDAKSCAQLIWRFRELADKKGKRCAFYAVSQAYLPVYLDLGMSLHKIGEVARVELKSFSLEGPSRKYLRQAYNRTARDGYVFEVVPAAEIDTILPTLREISDAWLLNKQGEEKNFSLGAFEESYMRHFDTAILRDETGEIVAFTNLFKGKKFSEVSLDLMRHRPTIRSFGMDSLFANLLLWAQAEGYEWLSLGAAPFSGLQNRQLASIWNRIGGFVYEHGTHFYNFEGLRAFKEKFGPEWHPHYLACPNGFAAPQVLYEVNVLVSGGLRGLMK